jgi:hypothetical protein
MIRSEDLVGRCLSQVTCSWFRRADGGEPELVHLWLDLDGLGSVRFHTLDHILDLRIDEPHGQIDMGEYGQITVGSAPEAFPLTRFVGQSVQAVRGVRQVSLGSAVGIRLDFAGGQVRVMALADELVVAAGLLSDRWEADLELVDSRDVRS